MATENFLTLDFFNYIDSAMCTYS